MISITYRTNSIDKKYKKNYDPLYIYLIAVSAPSSQFELYILCTKSSYTFNVVIIKSSRIFKSISLPVTH